MINLSEILSFLTGDEVAETLPPAHEISNQSLATFGYDCFNQFCSLTGAPVARLLPDLTSSLIRNSFTDNSGDMEAIVDDLSLRALTQCRPSPELTRLTPKSFMALPLRTQVAYLIGRWLNPSQGLTKLGVSLIDCRRTQLRVWNLLADGPIPQSCLASLHFRLLEVDSSLNLTEIPPPTLHNIEQLLSAQTIRDLADVLNSLGEPWSIAITGHLREKGNRLTQLAFLRSFLDQPSQTHKSSQPKPHSVIEIANNKLREQHERNQRYANRREAILADTTLTPVQRARKLDLAKRTIGDMADIAKLARAAEVTKPTIKIGGVQAPKLNLFAKKES